MSTFGHVPRLWAFVHISNLAVNAAGARRYHREIAEKRRMEKQGHGQKPALTQVYAQSFLQPLRLSNRN
jgi:hypothetical protein